MSALIDRRAFIAHSLQGTAAAAVVPGLGACAFVLGFTGSAEASVQRPSATGPEVNAWVVVHPDDRVVIRIARSEMGQGTLTGLAQLVAEELACEWSRVSTEYPTPGQSLARERVWGNFSTGGSRGLRDSHEYMRHGGAAARMMLVQAAANRWGVPTDQCRAEKGVVHHTTTQRRLRYGELAGDAAKLPVPQKPALKDPATWTLAGKPLARLDTVEKTNGSLVYGADLQLPGMLHAAIKACPVFGGSLKSFNGQAVANRPGVKKVVAVGTDAVAVVADTWWRAKSALDALPIDWDFGPHAKVQQADIDQMVSSGLNADKAVDGLRQGQALETLQKARHKIEATYAYPQQNHATMEPMNATALVTVGADGKVSRCEVWTPTQNGEGALAAAAEAAGLPPQQCEVYKLPLGGGFGRRGAKHDWVIQAVQIARQMPGVPVKLLWSREEDMAHGQYHPITQCKLSASWNDAGDIEALHMRIAGQSILQALFPQAVRDGRDALVFQGLNASGPESAIGYQFPSVLIDHAMRNPHVPPGFWRGVNLNQNAVYLECFLDEVAHASKQDPLALRLKLMQNHPKHRAVLQAVADRVGWSRPAPDIKGQKVFRGLAQTHGFGSYVAACAEVSVSSKGELKIHRIVAATDCGIAVNPQQIEAQVEGSFAYGLSAALYGSCTVQDGRIAQTNFHQYPVVRMADMPKVETIVMPSGGFWGGVGEPTIAVAAPAVLNAIFAATGVRIRQLPLGNQRLVRA